MQTLSVPPAERARLIMQTLLQMEKQFEIVRAKAITVPGVNLASIFLLAGLIDERHKNWSAATDNYRRAFLEVTDKLLKEEIEDSLKRVSQKVSN